MQYSQSKNASNILNGCLLVCEQVRGVARYFLVRLYEFVNVLVALSLLQSRLNMNGGVTNSTMILCDGLAQNDANI